MKLSMSAPDIKKIKEKKNGEFRRIEDLKRLILSNTYNESIYNKYVTQKIKSTSNIKNTKLIDTLKKSRKEAETIENKIFKQADKIRIGLLPDLEKNFKEEILDKFSSNQPFKKNIFTNIRLNILQLGQKIKSTQTDMKEVQNNLEDDLKKIEKNIKNFPKDNNIREKQMIALLSDIENIKKELQNRNIQTNIYKLAINLGYYAELETKLIADKLLARAGISSDKHFSVNYIAAENLKADILIKLNDINFGISNKAQVTLKELKEKEIQSSRLKLGRIKDSIENAINDKFKQSVQKNYNEYKIISYLYWLLGSESRGIKKLDLYNYDVQRQEIIELSNYMNTIFSASTILYAIGIKGGIDSNPVIFVQIGNEFHRVSDIIKFLEQNYDVVQAKMTFGYKDDKYILRLQDKKDTVTSLYRYFKANHGKFKGQQKTFVTNYILQKRFKLNEIYLKNIQ